MIGVINQRRPGSACSGKSSLSRKASECKSLRRCRHCERGEGVGNNPKLEKSASTSGFGTYTRINIVAINWQYLHTVYLFRERAKSI